MPLLLPARIHCLQLGAEASIPLQRELGIGILKKLIRQAGLSVDEFNRL
ncbi:MAG: hypothetical protein ABIK21_00815 [bacterium]